MNSLQLVEQRKRIAELTGYNPNDLSQSYLRSDVLLDSGAQFAFDFTFNKTGSNKTEKLLATNDIFIITAIGIRFKKISSATPTDILHSNAKSYTFINTAAGIFDGAAGDAKLQGLYSGNLSVLIDNKNIFPAIPMQYFERITTAQQGNINAAIAGPVTYTTQRDANEGSNWGFFPVEPFIIKGDGKNYINLNGPVSQDYTEANENNYATCYLSGYLGQNCNNVRS